ncbi:hypothetical protein [Oceanitalea stevensii]|uniref:Peptidase M14 carboxypeptidase A domain-containing protein n=1 Tax=Oceanitalea stevensii TaxID=2763072 RepID=A0ABR8YYB9_9MICO|nr:hypothetical protein [Oceanitalea stevensii]MBD8061045.1 hypothetical protein [Oceanitalea stevensii]
MGPPSRRGRTARRDDARARPGGAGRPPTLSGAAATRTEPGRAVDLALATPPSARLSPAQALHLQRTVGNQQAQRLLRPVVQRTPLSDALDNEATGKPPSEIFALVGEKRFKDGALDATELAALTGVLRTALPRSDDHWMALRILRGQLGMSGGVTKAEAPTLAKDIPPQPVVVHFVKGRSDERALVIAGVHGSERQGIEVAQALLATLQKQQPHYSVVVVPSLFPQHADPAWGEEGTRQRGTQTNRNFPSLEATVGSYSGGKALDPSGKELKAAPAPTASASGGDGPVKVSPILAENVMLMELIDRFHPSRIISIHGTKDTSASGVFADPHFTSPAKKRTIEAVAAFRAFLAAFDGMAAPQRKALMKQLIKDLTRASEKADSARTQNDVDLALATAYAIQSRATGASLKGRSFPVPTPERKAAKKPTTDEEKKAAEKAKRAEAARAAALVTKKRASPSVTGNKLYEGAGKENATWREDMGPGGKPKPWKDRANKKGISLGLYGPAKDISVFTVEPPVNRALDQYDGTKAEPGSAVISKADRESELKAYADAVAVVLLGPDPGATALATQRPAPAP